MALKIRAFICAALALLLVFTAPAAAQTITAAPAAAGAAATITVGGTAVVGGTAGDILGISNAGALVADTMLQMVTPVGGTYVSGQYLKLPIIVNGGGGDVIFGTPVGYLSHAHAFIGCDRCTISESAAGTTAFVGTDGSTTPVIGNATAGCCSGGLHMSVLGPSVDAEGDGAVVIGHGATVKPSASASVVIGENTSAAGNISVLIGQGISDLGGSGFNTAVGRASGFDVGSGDSIQIQNRTCARQANNQTVEIGYGACASSGNRAVVGGSLINDFYTGSETPNVRFHSSLFISHGSAPTLTFGSCTANSWVGGSAAGTFTASAACAAGTYGVRLNGGANGAPNGLVCFASDMTTAATIRQTATTSNLVTFTVSGVLNGDVIQMMCMGY